MENAVTCIPMPGLMETTEGVSGCRCMLWATPSILMCCMFQLRGTQIPHPLPTLHPSICPIPAAWIWAALCRPNDLLQGSITLCVSWLMQSSVGRTQGSGLLCPPAHRACRTYVGVAIHHSDLIPTQYSKHYSFPLLRCLKGWVADNRCLFQTK